MDRLNIALIGYGHLGKWHTEKIQLNPRVNLHSIVELNKENQKIAQEKYPKAIVTESLNKIINDIDAAIVVTPTTFHYEVVVELLKAKKHVFCEKPLASNLSETEEIKNLLEQNPELVLQVGHSERAHEVWEKTEDFPLFFKEKRGIAHFKRVAPYKGRATDVDVIQDLMIHDIDLAFHLFGQNVVSVRAAGEKIRTQNMDYVWAEVIYDGGLRATFIASRNDVVEQRTFEIINKNGTFLANLFKNEYSYAKANSVDEDSHVVKNSYNKRDHLNFAQELFYDSIENKSPIFVDVKDALKVAKVMDAIQQSIATNKEIQV